mgnify:CR=1 FL=1
MSKPRRQLFGFLTLCALVFLATLTRTWFDPPDGESEPSSIRGAIGLNPAPDESRITVLPMAAELSASLRQENGTPEDELAAVGQLLYFYRQAFGENPVGDNTEIVAALSGGNVRKAAWLPQDCPAVAGGKLVDRWGSPYFFHALSAREMEIRSAGPDRELFTSDDLTQP